jgi:hypothetical protein
VAEAGAVATQPVPHLLVVASQLASQQAVAAKFLGCRITIERASGVLARALETFGTLDALQIDEIIATVDARVAREAEQQRRRAWRTKVTAATAAEFEVMFP